MSDGLQIDPPEAAMGPDELRAAARRHEGLIYGDADPRGGRAADFDWHFDPAFPLDRLDAPENWSAWFQGELTLLENDIGSARDWERICEEPIEEAIVVVLAEGRPAGIWDGWHRAGGSVHAGRTHIPAIVGTRRSGREKSGPPTTLETRHESGCDRH